MDKGDFVCALFIDFRKAFDVVDHSILIRKLSMYIFEEQSLLWFISYLKKKNASKSLATRDWPILHRWNLACPKVLSLDQPFSSHSLMIYSFS